MTTSASPRTVELPGLDGQRLAGLLDLPQGEVRATALFAHCFTCSSRSHAAARISRALADEGVAVLRIDFTGLGESGGDFADTGFGTNVEDLVAAASWLADELGPVNLLVGHSLGGAAVIAAAGQLPDVQAVAVIGAPASPEHVAHLVSELDDDEAAGAMDDPVAVDIGGRPFRLRRSFLDEVRGTDQEARIAELRRPLLVLHSPTDNVVGVDNARRVFDAAVHPKSFVSLDGADHLVSDPADARWIAALISIWAARYVVSEPEQDSEDAPAPAVEEGLVVTELDAEKGYAHRAATPTHAWLLDEPAEVGGEDRGPNPYDQLLAALGACTSMTMRMYARRKGWDVGEMEVRLRHDRVHAADCADCETTSGQVDVIDREVVLPDGLDPERRTALLAIADKCPVHRTLTREVRIRTTAP